jgi:hypothetical protein
MPNENAEQKGDQAILSAPVDLRDCARKFMHDVP